MDNMTIFDSQQWLCISVGDHVDLELGGSICGNIVVPLYPEA